MIGRALRQWLRPTKRADAVSARGFAAYGAVVFGASVTLYLLAARSELHGAQTADVLSGPSFDHPLGTDGQGRDLLALLGLGQLTFYPLAIKACLIGVGGGVTLGVAAGFFGGLIDRVIRYIGVVMAAFPRLPLLLLVATAFGPRFSTIIVALGLSFVPNIMSEVRQKVVHLRQAEHTQAARIHGLSWWRIVTWHIGYLHLLPTIVRQAVFLFAYVILMEAALSFIGTLHGYLRIESDASVASLGELLSQAQDLVFDAGATHSMAWWPLAVISVFLVVLVSGWTAFGEAFGLREAE